MMERYTANSLGKCSKAHSVLCAQYDKCQCCHHMKDAMQRLAYYEDLEEQGRLVVLPCKVGDTLFFVMNGEIYSGVVRYLHWKQSKIFDVHSEVLANTTPYASLGASFDDFGKTVFLTREDAEQALATDKNVGSKNGGAN